MPFKDEKKPQALKKQVLRFKFKLKIINLKLIQILPCVNTTPESVKIENQQPQVPSVKPSPRSPRKVKVIY